VVVNHAIRINGINRLTITKLDVLNDFEEIKICVEYRLDGKVFRQVPSNPDRLAKVEPVYESMEGWRTDISGVRDLSGLLERPGNTSRKSKN